MTDLTIAETRTLARHEAIITAGQKHFVSVGNALAAIRDARLYRADYDTFTDYCRERWGFSNSRAYQFIEAAIVVNELPSTIGGCEITNERQARALSEVPIDQRAQILQAAAEESPSGKPTAKKIAQAAARLNPGPASDYDDIDFGPPGPPTPAKAREPDPFDEMYYDDAEREDDANIAPARQEPNIIGARKEEFRDWWQAVLTDPPHVAAYMRTFIAEELG